MKQTVTTALVAAVASVVVAVITTFGSIASSRNELRDASEQAQKLSSQVEESLLDLEVRPIPVAQGAVAQNTGRRPIIVVGYCNGTSDAKNITGEIGKTTASLELVATESGKQRGSLSFVVPPGWAYRANWDSVAGIGCRFQGWSV